MYLLSRVHIGYKCAPRTVTADHSRRYGLHVNCEGGCERICKTPTPGLATTPEDFDSEAVPPPSGTCTNWSYYFAIGEGGHNTAHTQPL